MLSGGSWTFGISCVEAETRLNLAGHQVSSRTPIAYLTIFSFVCFIFYSFIFALADVVSRFSASLHHCSVGLSHRLYCFSFSLPLMGGKHCWKVMCATGRTHCTGNIFSWWIHSYWLGAAQMGITQLENKRVVLLRSWVRKIKIFFIFFE